MPAKSILLINDDPSLVEFLQKAIHVPILSIPDTSRLRQKFKQHAFPLVILAIKKDWAKNLKRLLGNGKMEEDRYIIIGSAGMLKQTAERINEITAQVMERNPVSVSPAHSKPTPQKASMVPALEDFMEHRLKDFVKQMNASGGRNLYSILLREIEHPLISITLKETNGNQIRASHLLGINRNTLRKKIRELKIRVSKDARKKIK